MNNGWLNLLRIIEEEGGEVLAKRIENRARLELGGVRLTVSNRQKITAQMIQQYLPGKPSRAAIALGIHPSTAYRKLAKRK